MNRIKGVRWDIAGPIGLVVLALLAVAWLDVSKGGDAKPKAPLGEIGTPVRGAYVGPTPTPIGFAPTPKPRPTVAPGTSGSGNAVARDDKRREDLLLLLGAAARTKERNGAYPSTNGNVQTVCNYKDIDVGCAVLALADGSATIKDPASIGYWYSSNGQSAQFYASLEGDVAKEDQCVTNDAELKKHDNVICVKAQ